jgi:hypothetical protein
MSDILRRLKLTALTRSDATYRRANGTDVWHFCENCGTWPTRDFTEVTVSQYVLKGSLCLECIAKRHFGDCGKTAAAK